ncbi:hypothetical protein [Bacillus sp. 1P06AnD]|uniref:hypothetical protein n=1 Tax=Bacillus sp. 1P06AnD TaxID=3132208 RepID=UPI0039A2BC41
MWASVSASVVSAAVAAAVVAAAAAGAAVVAAGAVVVAADAVAIDKKINYSFSPALAGLTYTGIMDMLHPYNCMTALSFILSYKEEYDDSIDTYDATQAQQRYFFPS